MAVPIEDILKAALVFLRVSGILFFLPIFGDEPTPVRVRLLLAGSLAIGFFNIVPGSWNTQLTFDLFSLGWLVFKEILIGATIGFISKLAFDGLVMAASIVGFQMGFGTDALFIPDSGQQMDGFTALHRIILILIFLALSLHHIFINAIAQSFELIPVGGALPQAQIGTLVITLTANVFSIALQLAAPILVALLFTMAALGLVARTVPQLNVFTLSFPVSFFVGLLVYVACFPFFPEWVDFQFKETSKNIAFALKGMAP